MIRCSLTALACLLLSGCETVSSVRTEEAGAYAITARSRPFDSWPSASLLIGEAVGLCPIGYQRLGESTGDNDTFGGHFIEWRIRCNEDGAPAASAR